MALTSREELALDEVLASPVALVSQRVWLQPASAWLLALPSGPQLLEYSLWEQLFWESELPSVQLSPSVWLALWV